jgi:cytochrome b561
MSNLTVTRYPFLMRLLHWAMTVVILGLIGVGVYMTDLPKDDPSRGLMYGLHKSFGVIALLLVGLRILIRVMSTVPPLPAAFSAMEKNIIHAGHFALYVLMFLTPAAGYLMSCAAGKGVSLFGVALPSIIEPNKELAGFMNEAHEVLAFTLLAVIALHVLAVIKHARDRNPECHVLQRMK